MEQKYLIDTEENKMFLKEIRENLLKLLGHPFSRHRTGPAIILEMMVLHGKYVTAIHMRHAGCLMSIQSGNIWDMKAAKN